ncbi:DUF4198 domain-containing protein [Algicella marina]|uniref:DUF4198 domain-containing protein n=1 Tax=Algicella marina TaxID=2683284 RepID=A0A6P1T0Z4_9RHOB|nr:DUF4198 domain-containing protein [Algicella marina]QHQ36408.1 DUF4198 domain-containing protein [Algicella marina]
MPRLTYLLALTLSLLAVPVFAHEFWLEPERYQVPAGASVKVRAINGEDFKGTEYPYNARTYTQSGVVVGGQTLRMHGETGQRPAVQLPAAQEGLNVVFHASPVMKVVYDDFARFEKFLKGKKLEFVLEEHRAKGFPTDRVGESYYRFAKAMVAVGDGAGADKHVGMPFELVAETNPYTESGPVRFRLLWQGRPDANAPVFVFIRQNGAVKKLWLETDGEGRVEVPREAGEYMVNAVRIIEATPALKEQLNTVWTTLWASHVYGVEG